LKLLLDEMYSNVLAEALRTVDVDVSTVIGLGLAGRSDPDVFAAAVAQDLAILTENVASGHHHPGVGVALSSRFSRRRAGIGPLVAAIGAISDQQLEDRVVYLQHPQQP
jgi:hypothetical protein